MKACFIGLCVLAAVTGWALSLLTLGPIPSTWAAKPIAAEFTGVVSAVDAAGSSLTVRGAESLTFKVASDAIIVTKDKVPAKLGDLQVGTKVVVTYLKEDGGTTFTATRIEEIGA